MAQLRQILNEAPLVDLSEPVQDPESYDRRGLRTNIWGGAVASPEQLKKAAASDAKNKRAVDRFYSSKKYRDGAVKALKNLSIPIYLVPAFTPTNDEENRLDTYEGPERARERLSKLSLSPQKVDELVSALGRGACVIVSSASMLEKGFLPSPWMLVHAMFDNATRGSSHFDELYGEVYELADEIAMHLGGVGDKKCDAALAKIFTFASARNKELNSEGDLAADACVQAVLTTKGFVYNPSTNEDVNSLLKQMAEVLKNARAWFEKQCAGQLIVVDVFSDPDYSFHLPGDEEDED